MSWRFIAMIGLSALVAGCESLRTETAGEVSVGRPQVFSRERLMQERSNDLAWLDEQLARPFEQSLQGLRDVRTASALMVELSARIDVAKRRQAETESRSAELARTREEQLAAKQHDIALERLSQELAALKASPATAPASAVPAASPDLGKVNDAIAEINKKLAAIEDKLKPAASRTEASSLLANSQDRLVSPSAAERSTASLTNRDLFEDNFAFRDAVNARKREKFLDDTHDLAGFTLYEMKFDVAITPGRKTVRKAVVELTLGDGLDAKTYVDERFIARLMHRVAEDANVLIARQHGRLEAGKLSEQWKEWTLASVSSAAVKDCATAASSPGGAVSASRELLNLLSGKVRRGEAFAAQSNEVQAAQMGKCLVTRYVQNRLELALGHYFKFSLVSRLDSLGGNPGAESPLLDVEAQTNIREALVGRLNQLQALQRPWVATVDPKEYTQNISDVSSDHTIRQISLALSATDGKALSGDASARSFKEEQELLQAIKRQALATSFHNGRDKFGWTLGPRFEIRKGKAVFVHSTERYTFGASVVVPGWFDRIDLKACAYWIEEGGERSLMQTQPFGRDCDSKVTVNLPHSHRFLLHALMDSNQDLFNSPEIFLLPQARKAGGAVVMTGMPAACAVAPDKSCEQTLVIEGRELWRNPSVFVGDQKADRVDLLPSMRGVSATFRSLRVPQAVPGAGGARAQDLFIATSTGQDRLEGAVLIVEPVSKLPKPFARMSAPYVERSGTDPMEVVFTYRPGTFPENYSSLAGRMRKAGDPKWIDLPGDAALASGRVAYKVTDLSKFGLDTRSAEMETDLAFKFSPDGEWVSMMESGTGKVVYVSSRSERELTYAPAAKADFSSSADYGDKQRQMLRQALRFNLPSAPAVLMKANPGLEAALRGEGGTARISLADGDGQVALAAELGKEKDRRFLQPRLASLANRDAEIVPRNEEQRTLALSVSYRTGAGIWIELPLSSPAELKLVGRKKPAPPKTPVAEEPKKP